MSRSSRKLPSAPRAACLLSAGASLIWIPQAFVLARAVADAVSGAAFGAADLLVPAALFLVLALVRTGLDTLSVRLAATHAAAEKHRIRATVAATVAAWSPVDATRPPVGEVATLVGDQVESLEPFIVRYGPARFRVSVVPIVIALVVAWYAWAAALVLVLAFPFIPLLTSLIGMEARDRSKAQLAEVGTFTGVLLDKLAGLSTIRLFGAVDRTAEAIGTAGDGIRRRTMGVLALAFLSSAVIEVFSAIGVGLVAIFIGFSLLGWIDFGVTGAPLDLASGLFVLLLAPDFFQPLRDFSAAYHDKAAAEALMDRHDALIAPARPRLLRADPAPAAPPVVLTHAAPAAPTVTVHGLTVTAPGGAVMVADVSFEVSPGETVALWGPSGAGKSTVLAALAGLVAPSAGTITVGDDTLSPTTADAIRRRVAWIGQTPLTLSASLARNLTLAEPADRGPADPCALERAIADAGLGAFVARLPRGLATPIGEAGAGLSGGELRRLAVARALVADRPLVLADEPTADLDADTADAVRAGLLKAAAGRTLIVATHDPLLARQMDRVIRLAAPSAPPPPADPAAPQPAADPAPRAAAGRPVATEPAKGPA
ncbi:thiol reductant ABC exporter subunit CydD [Mongoliimonas terrestris]|uniref:thiol reductant ABC exporter subunit CydD n=1 Tax=Mongoliimonas terrestris TaxID=1709001 RepID=UPI0009494FC0|nr:thiol reductant ABC exporter subunit CydD [Mongoliimonas terrestris]